jgi:aromatic-L-amino-acid decarboxylase
MTPDELRRRGYEVVDWIAAYLAEVEHFPVLSTVRPGELQSSLPASPPEHGESMEDILDDFERHVLPGVTHWNHPAFFAYFANTGSGPGILGEMISAALNVNAMLWKTSPAGTELETLAVDWVRQLVGLPVEFEGVINDTASTSSLYALAAAREAGVPDASEHGLGAAPPCAIYCSEQAHSSIDKAVQTLGFGRAAVRRVRTDPAFRMDAGALAETIEADVAAGVHPVCVVATVGSTATGSVDPVDSIADVAAEHGLWLHVDAAYGGAAAALPELRDQFLGWERAHSVVLNPHKWLFTPMDCSILFCRRPDMLKAAFSLTPEYLRTAEQGEVKNLMDYGVSLGRRMRGLKLWFVMRYFGAQGIRSRLREHVSLAHALADRVAQEDGWELASPASFSTLTMRCTPAGIDPSEQDALNHHIIDRVNRSGEAFLSHAVLGGRVAIRFTIGNVRTEARHVQRAWELMREAAKGAVGVAAV